MSTATDQLGSAYIRPSNPDRGGGGVDREARLHQRRKSAMVSLLSEFEREIEPHIGKGHREAIESFKRSCREKLNGLTWEAIELMKGGDLNEHAVDLAAQLAFDANGGHRDQ